MVTADVSVRVAWPGDAEGIAAVQVRAWQHRYGALPLAPGSGREVGVAEVAHAWRETLARPPEARHRALVALDEDTVVGFALTVPGSDPDSDAGADGEIVEFTVDPARTGEGHGSRLQQACVDTLAADRFTRATWWVDSTDDGLRSFLSGAGWAPDGASRELDDGSDVGADGGGAGAGTGGDGHGARLRQVRLHTAL